MGLPPKATARYSAPFAGRGANRSLSQLRADKRRRPGAKSSRLGDAIR